MGSWCRLAAEVGKGGLEGAARQSSLVWGEGLFEGNVVIISYLFGGSSHASQVFPFVALLSASNPAQSVLHYR